MCDFGLSLILDEGPTGYTSSEFGGTLRYLAPELLEKDGVRTTATDVYALGCTCAQVGDFFLPVAYALPDLHVTCSKKIILSKQPYESSASDAQLMKAINLGLPPFEFGECAASFPIYPSVLRSTWNHAPSKRPTVKKFVVALRAGPRPRTVSPQPDPRRVILTLRCTSYRQAPFHRRLEILSWCRQ